MHRQTVSKRRKVLNNSVCATSTSQNCTHNQYIHVQYITCNDGLQIHAHLRLRNRWVIRDLFPSVFFFFNLNSEYKNKLSEKAPIIIGKETLQINNNIVLGLFFFLLAFVFCLKHWLIYYVTEATDSNYKAFKLYIVNGLQNE